MYFHLLSNQLLIANFDENWIYLCSVEKYSISERRKGIYLEELIN